MTSYQVISIPAGYYMKTSPHPALMKLSNDGVQTVMTITKSHYTLRRCQNKSNVNSFSYRLL